MWTNIESGQILKQGQICRVENIEIGQILRVDKRIAIDKVKRIKKFQIQIE